MKQIGIFYPRFESNKIELVLFSNYLEEVSGWTGLINHLDVILEPYGYKTVAWPRYVSDNRVVYHKDLYEFFLNSGANESRMLSIEVEKI